MKEKARQYTPSPIPRLEDAFLTTYIMLLEHDSLNHRHLVDACLPALLRKYIAERLHRGSNDYPTEDTCNVLAVALFWHMTSQGVCFERLHSTSVDLTVFPSDALNGEPNDSRNKVIDILLPLTFAWFRVRPLRSLSPLPLIISPASQYTSIDQGFDPYVLVHGGGPSSRLSSPTHSPVHPSPLTVSIDYVGHGFGLRLPAAIISRMWTPVCDCHRGGWKCDGECVPEALIEESLFLPPVLYVPSPSFLPRPRSAMATDETLWETELIQ